MEKIIFKTIVGSQAYGTNTKNSDTDIKGVYIQKADDLLTFNYKEQYEVSKDETYFEVRRFLQLLESANPTVLEMLFMPTDCIIKLEPVFELIIQARDNFLTKKCFNSFGGYAIAQIKKARALDKKMNWETERFTRKTAYDFCYIYEEGKTFSLKTYIEKNQIDPEKCGLVKLNHFKDCYALYTSKIDGQYDGIFAKSSTEVKLSKVDMAAKPMAIMYYNKEGFSSHCKDYLQYNEWLKNRNTQRYVDVKGHNQKIDGKNLLHCRRLLDMAFEIVEHKTLSVRRPNTDYLLKIRKGEVDLESIVSKAEEDLVILEDKFNKADLPSEVEHKFLNELLLKIRHY